MRLKSAGGISLLSLSSLPSASVARLSVLLCNSVIGHSFQPCSYRKGYQSGAQRLPFLGRRLEQPLGVGGYALLANAIHVYTPSKLDRTQPSFCRFWPMRCLLVLSQTLFSDLFAWEQLKSATFSSAQHSIRYQNDSAIDRGCNGLSG